MSCKIFRSPDKCIIFLVFKTLKIVFFFFIHKMVNNFSAKCYKKQKVLEMDCEMYQNLSEETKVEVRSWIKLKISLKMKNFEDTKLLRSLKNDSR